MNNRDQTGKFKKAFFKELYRKRNGIAFSIVTIVALWPTVWNITQSFVEFPNISYAKSSTIYVEQTLQEQLEKKVAARFEENKKRYMDDARLEVMLDHNEEFKGILNESMELLTATSTN